MYLSLSKHTKEVGTNAEEQDDVPEMCEVSCELVTELDCLLFESWESLDSRIVCDCVRVWAPLKRRQSLLLLQTRRRRRRTGFTRWEKREVELDDELSCFWMAKKRCWKRSKALYLMKGVMCVFVFALFLRRCRLMCEFQFSRCLTEIAPKSVLSKSIKLPTYLLGAYVCVCLCIRKCGCRQTWIYKYHSHTTLLSWWVSAWFCFSAPRWRSVLIYFENWWFHHLFNVG